MNVIVEDINDTRKRLSVTLEAEEIQKERDAVLKEVAKAARLPGFRPGKAPLPMIAKRFSREIGDRVKQNVLNDAYRQAIEESKLQPFKLVEIDGGEQLAADGNREVAFVLDVRPDFNLPEYKGIEIEEPSEEVTDAEIDTFIDRLRSQRAEFTTVEREAAQGDYVKLSYEGKIDGKLIAELVPDAPVFGTQNSTWEEVGAEEEAIPGFSSGLAGLKAGDRKEISVDFPENFPQAALRGQKAVYSLEMQEVREKKMPELDEEFLKGLQVESVEKLREQVRANLEQTRKRESEEKKRQQLTERLGSMVEFPLPESAVERETQNILRQFLETNLRRGVPQEEFEKRKEELYDGARRSAFVRVKLQFILAKIAAAEDIKATDEDLSRVIYFEAQRRREKPEKFVKELRKNPDEIDAMRQSIIFDKTLDFLLENAKLRKATS